MRCSEEYESLIDIMVSLVQSQAGSPIEGGQAWVNDAQTLSVKLFRHLVSMQCLMSGATVSGSCGQIFCIDHSSIKVVARAALETYLVFFYVFGKGIDKTAKYRHLTWKLAGLTDRQKFFVSTERGKAILAQEKLKMDKLKREISGYSDFNNLSQRQKDKILKGEWRAGKAWSDIGVEAGFHKTYFQNIYGYLCGYSHSSYISALQVGQAKLIEDQHMLAEAIMRVGLAIMAHHAHSYSGLFENAACVLENHPAKCIAEKWRFGAEDMAAIYDH